VIPKRIPIETSITSRFVGAYEMNGSGTPVSGAIPSTTKMLRIP